MTKISNQYSLTNILTADLANSRLGINNVSPTVALDVTGAGKFSSSVNVQNFLTVSGATTLVAPTSGKSIEMVYRLDGANDYAFIQAYDRTASVLKRLDLNASMTILPSGNVGIGSTTAGAQLTLAQNNPNTSAQTYLTFRNLAAGYGSWSIWKNGGNDLAFYYGVDSDTPSAGINMKLRYNGITDFYTQVCIGTSTTGVYGSPLSMANASSTAKIWSTGPNTGGDYIVYSNSGGGIVGVYVGYGATSWTGASDIRLKNIIEPIDNAVDKLLTLNPIVFSWKHDSENKENLGLIAQDIEKVFPQIVDIQNDEIKTKGVRYTELIPVLVKAIQELSAKVSLLENK